MAVSNRVLNAGYSGALSVQYRRTDVPEAGAKSTRDDVQNNDANMSLAFGTGLGQADLFHHNRITLSGPVIWSQDFDVDFDDIWGVPQNFNAIKILQIRNREATNLRPLRFLKVWTALTVTENDVESDIKTEQYYIGPQGSRVILEPSGAGLRGEAASSSSVDEGNIIFEVTGSYDVTFDLFIVGSSAETSSSGT